MEQVSIDIINQEGILIKEHALWHSKKLDAQTGTLFLTPKRIAFRKDTKQIAGIFSKLFSKQKDFLFDQDIPLDKIKGISNESFGINKNILVLFNKDYSTVKFFVKNFNEWQERILELIVKNRKRI